MPSRDEIRSVDSSEVAPPEGALFSLVFEGPRNDSPDTIRKLKGVFIAELDYTIDQTIHALQSFPGVVKTAAERSELESYYKALLDAGAKVSIVRPKEPEVVDRVSPRETVELDGLEFFQEEQGAGDNLVVPPSDDAISSLSLSFVDEVVSDTPSSADAQGGEIEIELAAVSDEVSRPPTPPTVFEIKEDLDLEAALAECAESHEGESAGSPLSEPPSASIPPSPTHSGDDAPLFSGLDFAESDDEPLSVEVVTETPAIPTGSVSDDAREFLLSDPLLETPSALELSVLSNQEERRLDPPTLDLEVAEEISDLLNPSGNLAPLAPNREPFTTFGLEDDTNDSAQAAPAETAAETPLAEPESLSATTAVETQAEAETRALPADDGATVIPTAPEGSAMKSGRTKRPSRGGELLSEVAAPILIGALILGVVNWWVAEQRPTPPALTAPVAITKFEPEESDPLPVSSAPREGDAVFTISGAHHDGGFSVEWSARWLGTMPQSLTVSVVPPPLPELTPEQIAAQMQPPPEVTRIEVAGAVILNAERPHEFSMTGPARVWYRDAGQQSRFVVTAQVDGELSEQKIQMLRIRVLTPDVTESGDAQFVFERRDDKPRLALVRTVRVTEPEGD